MRSQRISRALTHLGFAGARVAVVLGSGLGGLAQRLKREREASFAEVDGMPESSVPGHSGRFLFGTIGGERVLVQAGRIHLYEGWTPRDVSASVRAFARLGCGAVVLTNAAGGLRSTFEPPVLMRLVDHIDLQGVQPLAPGQGGRGSPYDPSLGEAFDRAAEVAGIALARGVYAGVRGPSYETPAEVRMLAWMGADAVGMSTVVEAQAARAAGMRVAAVSCITNLGAGLGEEVLSHEDVVRAGSAMTERLGSLFERALPRILRALG